MENDKCYSLAVVRTNHSMQQTHVGGLLEGWGREGTWRPASEGEVVGIEGKNGWCLL